MVVNSLYYNRDDADGTVSYGALIDDDVILKSLANIYNKEFHPDKEIEPEAFRAVWNKINEATDKGYGVPEPKSPDFDFYNQLKSNNAVFAAFKVHRAQNDMVAQLIDDKGNLKPFKQYLNDVMPIASHQYGPWLRTEYDTAVLRAHQAADWQQFEREKDVLPNLEWMPSTSVHPGEDHTIFWGTIMPVNDPFWDEHRPGDRWNCKCSLQQTDKEPTGVPEDIKPSDKPQPGLDNNPGKDAKLFSDSHPYIANANEGADNAVKNAVDKAAAQRRSDIQEKVLTPKRNRFVTKKETGKIEISNQGISEYLNQPHRYYAEKNELALDLNTAIQHSTYITSHIPFKKTKKMRNVEMQYFYETTIGGKPSWFIIDKYTNGNVIFHGVSDNPKVLKDPKKQ